METHHKLIFGNSMSMIEIPDESIHLIITSPPYFNAPFDCRGLFNKYQQYLVCIKIIEAENTIVYCARKDICFKCDDMLVNGEKYPITADAIKPFQNTGF